MAEVTTEHQQVLIPQQVLLEQVAAAVEEATTVNMVVVEAVYHLAAQACKAATVVIVMVHSTVVLEAEQEPTVVMVVVMELAAATDCQTHCWVALHTTGAAVAGLVVTWDKLATKVALVVEVPVGQVLYQILHTLSTPQQQKVQPILVVVVQLATTVAVVR